MDDDQSMDSTGTNDVMDGAINDVSRNEKERYAEVKTIFMDLLEQEESARESVFSTLPPRVAAEVRSLFEHVSQDPLIHEPDEENAKPEDPLGLTTTLLDERYKVGEFVAEGGFSYVYKAEQIRWERPVAIKIFKIERTHDDKVRKSFVKEGALLAQLSQQTTAIVQSYDIGEFTDAAGQKQLFMALEWLNGRTLARLCAENMQPWSFEKLFQVLDPIAHGLGVAHESGIAHRDVKPSNIFVVERRGEALTTKLLDFGVAKVAAENDQGFKGTGGTLKAFTLGYGAPEQIAQTQEPTGPWTDVYSLALVASELLAGRRIVDTQDPISALKRLNNPSLSATPRELGANVPKAVNRVFQRALEEKASHRQKDVSEFWAELKEAVPKKHGTWSAFFKGE
ncbi:MAG: serine/threonine protein kinase [Deltaproteobacteria bacterium]|nr:serine/threonine protein kinase [Deltaproteobacteria bacterium]